MMWLWIVGICAIIFVAFVLVFMRAVGKQNEKYDNGTLVEKVFKEKK